jgi:hypothetical protein
MNYMARKVEIKMVIINTFEEAALEHMDIGFWIFT